MMKKQFFRVKQLADQTFLRADKSEGLNHEELQIADHRVEYYRSALSAISKKLPPVGVGQAENADKRMKKYPEFQLGATLLEQALKNVDNELTCPLFQYVIRECGQIEQELAREQAEHESKVEQLVSNPLQPIIDNELPNVIKLKRNLNKYMLDKDSIKNRYHASKNGNQKDSLKEDMEEAELKVEQSRDTLASEMFNFLKKENELSQYMLQLLKLQRGYHESALKNLEKIIPELERRIGDSPIKPVFGISLEEHLRVTNKRLAYPLELCISFLNLYGMSEEGLFRSTGGQSKIKRLKLSIDSGCFTLPLLPEYRDVHVIAATLKSYLRELPEPLLTHTLYNEWMSIAKKTDEERLNIVQDILKKLPKANKDNLTYLIQFLARLSRNHSQNKMTSSNIAICIAPNLLFKKEGSGDLMGICSVSNMLVELFINNVEKLFPDDVNQYETLNMPELESGDKDEFVRPILDNVKLLNHDDVDYQTDNASPRPLIRNKKKAPEPPQVVKHDIDIERTTPNQQHVSYPSGSSTLNRSHKIRTTDAPKLKTSVGTNTDFPIIKKSNVENENVKNAEPTKGLVLVNVDDKTADMCVVSQPAANYQISKAKPVQQITAQTITIEDRLSNTSNSYENVSKPIAAPRSINIELEKSTFRLENPMTKSLNSIDIDGETVHIRNKDNDNNKPNKPAVPVRPASLRAQPRSSIEIDPTLHKTQCSVYSVANKQQPSIIHVHNRTEKYLAGHDNQMAEKEKFLGHHQQQQLQQQQQQQDARIPAPRLSLENKFNDINSNCDNSTDKKNQQVHQTLQQIAQPQQPKPGLTAKPPITKSTEKLNTDEKLNGNSKPSHIRTRSDGNIIDFSDIHGTIIQTPPSPKVLNKPSQPPPPPPIVNVSSTATPTVTSISTTLKKPDGNSTDF